MKKLKRWQIPFFAFAHFGPCMLSTVIIFVVLAIFTCNLLPKEYDEWGKKHKK